jgi:hypothetical protein
MTKPKELSRAEVKKLVQTHNEFHKGGLAQPNALNYFSGCPVQASLGRGFRERELSV